MRKIQLTILITALSYFSFGQGLVDYRERFISSKYGYSLEISKGFKKSQPSQKNTDLVFRDEYKASVSINVTDRLKEEYQLTGHSFTKELMEKTIRNAFPNYTITHWEKIYIDGEKAFLEESTGGPNADLSSMIATFYHEDKAFVITCSAVTNKFENYKSLFKNVINSVKLKK